MQQIRLIWYFYFLSRIEQQQRCSNRRHYKLEKINKQIKVFEKEKMECTKTREIKTQLLETSFIEGCKYGQFIYNGHRQIRKSIQASCSHTKTTFVYNAICTALSFAGS